jgi:hypothetical protein
MRRNELADALGSRPFRPFRIHVSDGSIYEVRHPELVHLTHHAALVCTPVDDQPPIFIERFYLLDLIHITQLEYEDSATSR